MNTLSRSHGFAELRRSRRQCLKAGGAGLLGLCHPKWLKARESRPELPVRAKSVIFLFQWGGPSHIDTFDMKPAAPDTVRSPYTRSRRPRRIFKWLSCFQKWPNVWIG